MDGHRYSPQTLAANAADRQRDACCGRRPDIRKGRLLVANGNSKKLTMATVLLYATIIYLTLGAGFGAYGVVIAKQEKWPGHDNFFVCVDNFCRINLLWGPILAAELITEYIGR